jgi:(p)ppGpp synthase/HD superfamily hydrolase
MRYLCDEDTIVAGLLHDALEDTDFSPQQIKSIFGAKVLKLVQEVSDRRPGDPWATRKNAYLKHLKTASKDACLIACADKINNLTSMMDGYKKQGNSLWKRFNASKEDKLAFYDCVYNITHERFKHPLVEELGLTLREAKLRLQ